jgi:hypothetical protein
MKKLAILWLIIGALAAFSLGCAAMTKKDMEVRCPRCGARFTIDEEIHMRDLIR